MDACMDGCQGEGIQEDQLNLWPPFEGQVIPEPGLECQISAEVPLEQLPFSMGKAPTLRRPTRRMPDLGNLA